MAVQSPSIRSAGAVALAAVALALSACGGDDSSDDGSSSAATTSDTSAAATTTPQGSASTRLALSAVEDGGLSFDRRALRAAPGDVTITFENPSGNQAPHAVEIEGEGVERASGTIQPGDPATSVTANLRPGTYTFYCPVGDHREEGMEGTLTVG